MFKEFFNKVHKYPFYMWLLILMLLMIAEIVATVLIPTWREYFFNGIEAKNYHAFYLGLYYFISLMGVFVLTQGFKKYVGYRLALLWRTAITEVLVKKWKDKGNLGSKVDNPDQRINQDAMYASELTMTVSIEIIIAIAVTVGIILSIHNYLLFILAFAYVILAMFGAYFFKNPMIDTDIAVQNREAHHRFSLAKRAMGHDTDSHSKYLKMIQAYMVYLKVYLYYSLFNATKSNFSTIIPLLILVPMYFNGSIHFGEIMKGISEFDLLVANSSILLLLYPSIIRALASYRRLKQFWSTLNET